MFTRIALGLRAYLGLGLGCLLCYCGPEQETRAHVILDSPNGRESLIGGADFTIDWHVEVKHNTLDWDLWYSTESSDGPWQELAIDLAAGDTNEGALHSFDWTVPDINSNDTWVRVRQDNAGDDYYDVSEASFSIVSMLGGGDFTGDGTVDDADLLAWERGFGSGPAAPADGDANLDGDADGDDFLTWQSEFSSSRLTSQVRVVPEPAATILLVIGMLVLLWQGR